MSRIIFTFLTFFIFLNACKKEETGLIDPETLGTKTFFTPSNSGLVAKYVFCMEQDLNGNMWFGTDVGLSKYDGKTWTNYNSKNGFTDNAVLAIKADPKGKIWLGVDVSGYLVYYDSSSASFKSYSSSYFDAIQSICIDSKGLIWMGTDGNGILYFDEVNKNVYRKIFTTNDSLNHISNMLIDKNNIIWAATMGGLVKYDGNSFTTLTYKEGLSQNNISCLLEDSYGDIWIVPYIGGKYLNRYDKSKFYKVPFYDSYSNIAIMSSTKDLSGNLWFGGLVVTKYNGLYMKQLNLEIDLNKRYIYCLFTDKSGNIWISVSNYGLIKYVPD